MDRKRKNIPAGVRWDVFQRDNFRCVYCGATRADGATLVVDHGDPFSKGGDDDETNYVTACKPCNAGKSAKIVIPPAAEIVCDDQSVTRRNVTYKNHLHADWADAFRQVCYSVEYLATDESQRTVRVVEELGGPKSRNSVVRPDFFCDFLCGDVGRVNAVIVDNCDSECFSEESKSRVRDAAILGYREPTLIVIGSPWFYWAVVVNDRYKGCPKGFTLDENLDLDCEVWLAGWYPDESWKFLDPRDGFGIRPRSFALRGWHMTPGEAAEIVRKELRNEI